MIFTINPFNLIHINDIDDEIRGEVNLLLDYTAYSLYHELIDPDYYGWSYEKLEKYKEKLCV